MVAEGRWRNRGPDLSDLMINYFSDLFKSTIGDMKLVLDCINQKITESQNSMLLRRVRQEEVKEALFSMHPEKSPGPDGLNPGFYQSFWDILGNDITNFCDEFITSGHLPAGLNKTQIVLIPKKSTPESMSDLRPISLCNVIYKIAAKVVASRMKPLLNDLISENQSAFVPGRLITDNVMVAFETMHYLKRKSQGREGFAALKLDMSKAYDRIEWPLLRAIMIKLGFCLRWVELIQECVTTVEYTILNEGEEIGPIFPQRGLRQGDPLSPYLFILIMEGLTAMIRNQEARGTIHGIAIARGAPSVSHLLFADDCFIFFKANPNEGQVYKEILSEYTSASGQVINFEKSSICFSKNVCGDMREMVEEIVGVRRGEISRKYLRLPSSVGRNKRQIL